MCSLGPFSAALACPRAVTPCRFFSRCVCCARARAPPLVVRGHRPVRPRAQVDHEADITAVATDVLTGEQFRHALHFSARRPRAFSMHKLRACRAQRTCSRTDQHGACRRSSASHSVASRAAHVGRAHCPAPGQWVEGGAASPDEAGGKFRSCFSTGSVAPSLESRVSRRQ